MILTQIHWNPDPELTNIFGFPIRYYGLLFACGLVLSVLVLRWIYKRELIPLENLDKLTVYGIVGILLGARLGHCLFYEPSYYLSHPLEMIFPIAFDLDRSMLFVGYQGLASHGGGLGFLIALYFYAKKTGYPLLYVFDLMAIVLGLTGGFIRLANFMNSEIIGMPTSKPWGVVFELVDSVPRHPAQLYEAVCYFLIFALLLWLYKTKWRKPKNGIYFGLVLVLVFVVRILVEFFKEDQVAFERGMALNMGQLLSIPYLLVGIWFVAYGIKKSKKSMEMITLQSKNSNIKIEKGELVGYEVNGHQYIHQKGSPGWSSADTEMFPIIGPVNEAGFQVKTAKGDAEQDQHGHLRQFPYKLVSATTTEAVFKKVYRSGTPIENSKFPKNSDKEYLNWPYSFQFEKRFTLYEDSLEITFLVSGDKEMPFMLGYHPAFKIHSVNPVILTNEKKITLDEVLAVGSRALQVADHTEITLQDEKRITIKTEGFGHFMCWTEVRNMVCIEPISFYPYAVKQQDLHRGFQQLENGQARFKVTLFPEA